MGRSQMPPLSLWLKGSETEPNAKSVPTSSHRNSFTHPCDQCRSRDRSGEIIRIMHAMETHAEHAQGAAPAARRAASAQDGPTGAGISAVSLFVSQPDRRSAMQAAQPARAWKRTARAPRSRGAQKVAANRARELYDLGRVGTPGRRLADPGARAATQPQRAYSC